MYKNPKNVTKIGQNLWRCDKNGTKCQNMHFMHKKCIKTQKMWQKLDKFCHNTGKMWQTEDKFCHNTYKMWQTGNKICHNKITISVRYVTFTLMYQTIVTNFVTLGTKMWQNTNPHKPRGCAVSSMWQKFCHISIKFVTCLSRPKTPSYQRLWGFWHQMWQNFRNY